MWNSIWLLKSSKWNQKYPGYRHVFTAGISDSFFSFFEHFQESRNEILEEFNGLFVTYVEFIQLFSLCIFYFPLSPVIFKIIVSSESSSTRCTNASLVHSHPIFLLFHSKFDWFWLYWCLKGRVILIRMKTKYALSLPSLTVTSRLFFFLTLSSPHSLLWPYICFLGCGVGNREWNRFDPPHSPSHSSVCHRSQWLGERHTRHGKSRRI